MAFRRENDRLAKLNSRAFSVFDGSHYGFGKCDQPDRYAYISDLHCLNQKLELRDGMAKFNTTGYPATVSNLLHITVGGVKYLGVVANGALQVYLVEDVLEGNGRIYYTVRQVRADFTVRDLNDSLNPKTVNDLIGREPTS